MATGALEVCADDGRLVTPLDARSGVDVGSGLFEVERTDAVDGGAVRAVDVAAVSARFEAES
jgi:hypothetical protein